MLAKTDVVCQRLNVFNVVKVYLRFLEIIDGAIE